MHYVIIWQNDPAVEQILAPVLARNSAAGVSAGGGTHFVRTFKMLSEGSPKGEWYDQLPIFSAIMSTADHALQAADRLAEMTVMFIFHQTSKPAVRSIMGALRLLTPDALDGLAAARNTDLSVPQVVLLSCESAADKVVTAPVPPVLQPWVDQARNMRNACFRGFRIRKVQGPGEYLPVVVTFSTGNAVTGGIVLDPWNAKFISLNGAFTPDGDWEYNTGANGQPDKTQTPSGGMVHGDKPGATPSTTTVPVGQAVPPLLPDLTQP